MATTKTKATKTAKATEPVVTVQYGDVRVTLKIGAKDNAVRLSALHAVHTLMSSAILAFQSGTDADTWIKRALGYDEMRAVQTFGVLTVEKTA